MTTFYAWIAELARRGILPGDFQYPFLIRGFLCVLVLAPILGGLSHLVVTRRMAFFSAALGQAALTGVAIGLMLGEPLNAPYGGMFGFCLLSTLAMVYVKRRATLPPDTLIGVFHALTLGLGLCLLVALTRQFNVHQVESVLFGRLLTVPGGRPAPAGVRRVPRGGAARARLQPPAARQPHPAAGQRRRRAVDFPRVLLRRAADAVDRRQPQDHRRAAGRGAGRRAGGVGAKRRAQHAQLPGVEHRHRVVRRRRRAGGVDEIPGAGRRRGGARGQRDLLRHARGRCRPAAAFRMSAAAARSITVRALSPQAELLVVVRAAMVIAVGVWLYVAVMTGVGGNAPRQRNLLP